MTLIVSDIIVAHPSWTSGALVVARLAQVCMWIYIIKTIVMAVLLHGRFARLATSLLKELVEEGNENALRYIVSTVTLRCILEISTDMLELLTREAIVKGLLGNTEKAMLIYALQNIGLTGSRRRQEAVLRIM